MSERAAGYEVDHPISPQRRFRVRMECADGRVVGVTVTAGSMESVIDQVKGRRLAIPLEMVAFTVEVVAPAAVRAEQ